MALYNKKRLILAKHETVYGTDAVPAAGTDDVLVSNINPTPLDTTNVDRNLIRPYFGISEQIPANSKVLLEFDVEMAGMGALGVANAGVSALLRACGLAETVVASTSVTYDPVSSAFGSASIYFNLDGVLHKLTGSRGSVAVSMKAQGIPMLKFRMVGLFNAVTDTAAGTPDFSAYKTPVLVNNTNTIFSIHSISAVMDSLDIDLANNVVFRSLVGGSEQVLITDRKPTGSLSIENNIIATKNWYSAIQNVTTGALSVAHGPAGNRCTITSATVQLTQPKLTDSDGISMLGMGMQFIPTSAGNDEISIKFD